MQFNINDTIKKTQAFYVYVMWPFGVLCTYIKLRRLDKKAFFMFIDELSNNRPFAEIFIANGFVISKGAKKANALFSVPVEAISNTPDGDRVAMINMYITEKLMPISNKMTHARVLDITSLTHRLMPGRDKVLVSITSAYFAQCHAYRKIIDQIKWPSIACYASVAGLVFWYLLG